MLWVIGWWGFLGVVTFGDVSLTGTQIIYLGVTFLIGLIVMASMIGGDDG